MSSTQPAPPRWHTWVYLVLLPIVGVATWSPDGISTTPVHLVLLILAVAVALVLRVRYPYLLVAVGLVALVADLNVMATLAMFAFAIRRKPREVGIVGALWVAVIVAYTLNPGLFGAEQSFDAEPNMLAVVALLLSGVLVFIPALLGLYVQTSRHNVHLLTVRARAAEDEQELRARDAVLSERQRIATEMHDSLGHRIALLTMQAGALEVNASAGPEVVARHAGMMREDSP